MKNLKTLSVMALTAAIMTGCSEEQTAFDINNVPGSATIQGTIVYNEGTTIENGRFAYDYRPAANLPVIVIVNNNDYSGNLNGETVFETVTDESGKYSIEIPAPLMNGEATVRTADFAGVHKSVVRKNNQIVTEDKNVVYGTTKTINFRSQSITYCDMVCTERSAEDIPTGMVEYATLTGKIGQGYEMLFNNSVVNCFTEVNGADVMLNITYSNGQEFTYNVTTGANGTFSVLVPVEEFPASFSYGVEVLPYEGTFTTYDYSIDTNSYRGYTLSGYYAQNYGAANTNGSLSYPLSTSVNNVEVQAMVFEPNAGQDTYNYNAYYFFQPLQWVSEVTATEE